MAHRVTTSLPRRRSRMRAARRPAWWVTLLVLASLAMPSLGWARGPLAHQYTFVDGKASREVGAARVTVRAPSDVLSQVLTDYRRFDQVLTNLDRASVMGKHGKHTDVYVEAPVAKGTAKVWGVLRFAPIEKLDGGNRVLKAKLVKGNIERMDVTCIVSPKKTGTELDIRILLVPKVSLPSGMVAKEVASVAAKLVHRLRDRAERISDERQASR